MLDLSTSWDNKNSSDSHAVNYLKNALAIIPTPVDYTSDKFVKFWNRSTQYLNYFGVYKDDDRKWSVRVSTVTLDLHKSSFPVQPFRLLSLRRRTDLRQSPTPADGGH